MGGGRSYLGYGLSECFRNDYSAFLACSLSLGAVPSFVICCFSISAAHKAAPTVLVNAKKIEARGMSSSRTTATPNLPKH